MLVSGINCSWRQFHPVWRPTSLPTNFSCRNKYYVSGWLLPDPSLPLPSVCLPASVPACVPASVPASCSVSASLPAVLELIGCPQNMEEDLSTPPCVPPGVSHCSSNTGVGSLSPPRVILIFVTSFTDHTESSTYSELYGVKV